jgi:hypothetical protein
MITITSKISYTDTRENMEFWAKAEGVFPRVPANAIDAPVIWGDYRDDVTDEELGEVIKNYFNSFIQERMTQPIKQEVEQVAERQIRAEAEALKEDLQEQKVAEVLSRLTIE